MTPVSLDTVGLLAIWDVSDQWHGDADAAYQKILAAGRSMVATPQVLYECGNAAARKPYRSRVSALRLAFARDRVMLEPTPG